MGERTFNKYYLMSMIISATLGAVTQWLEEVRDPDSEGGKKITTSEVLDGVPIITDGIRQAIEAKIFD